MSAIPNREGCAVTTREAVAVMLQALGGLEALVAAYAPAGRAVPLCVLLGDGVDLTHYPLLWARARVLVSGDLSPFADDVWEFPDVESSLRCVLSWDGQGEPEGWDRHPKTGRYRALLGSIPSNEWLDFARKRALDFLARGELVDAAGSLTSDLGKQPSTARLVDQFSYKALELAAKGDVGGLRLLIEQATSAEPFAPGEPA